MSSKDSKGLRIRVIKPCISKYCVCPSCGLKQRFKKENEHWKTVKDFHLDKPILLKVLVVSAKCLNPHCKIKSFPLPVKGVTKYQRATDRVIKEGVAGNVLDNTPPEKIKGRFARSFNVTGSRPTLDRWKNKEADKLNFKDLIEKLKPSRVLCLDDLDPERSTRKHLIISDRIKGYILYLDALLDQSEEEVVKYLTTLKGLGINEVTCFIVDMWKSFPPAIHKVYPEAKIQYDHFHIWEAVNRHLDNAMKDYSRYLRYTGFPELAKRVWCYRRTFLKHPKRYTEKDKEIMDEIILSCRQ